MIVALFFRGSSKNGVYQRFIKYIYHPLSKPKSSLKYKQKKNVTLSKEDYKAFVEAFEMISAAKIIQVLCLP